MKNRNDNLKRVIVDYQKLNEDILNLLVEKFPDGYDIEDIISFRNLKNEIIEAVEVRTDDTIYLVKVGKKLVKAMEEFEEDNNYDDDDSETDENIDVDSLNEDDMD
jgi:DNA-directed RNA polymerase subunit delta